MKHAIVIADGAADAPSAVLGGRTTLQAAQVPTLDALARRGRLGVAPPPGPDIATTLLALLGYPPEKHQAGAGALRALARGQQTDLHAEVFCCDLVTVIDGYLRDFTAGFIPTAEAAPLIGALNAEFADAGFEVRACHSYRNVALWEGVGKLAALPLSPPDQVLHEPLERHLPRGRQAQPLVDLVLRAHRLLSEHDVNVVRQDLGENPANAIWLWGGGPLPRLPRFAELYGVRGALVAGSDAARGLGQLIGWEVPAVPGATGLPDTDYAAKGRAAVELLDTVELVCVHVRAPYILGRLGEVAGKLNALAAVDQQIVAPLLERLSAEPDWRMLVIATPATSALHAAQQPLHTVLLLAGSGIDSHRGEAFDEQGAAIGEIQPERVCDLMEYALRR